MTDLVSQLERLADLRSTEALTAEEFTAAKQQLLEPTPVTKNGDLSTPGRGEAELERLLGHIGQLGPPESWDEPTTYTSIPLAILDSVWSISVRYDAVLNVVSRYRLLRESVGGDADTETTGTFVRVVDEIGGPEGLASAVQNRQRTSTSSGILKAEAVYLEARILVEEGITLVGDLRATDDVQLRKIATRWSGEVPGQISGLSWDYFLMLCGLPGVKSDRMVRRFVAEALNRTELDVSASHARELVVEAADRLAVDTRFIDYAIWQYQRAR